ncbi:hypothetical protein QBC46DRAFT_428278 [Diplogelasinospora grovesii]|uniref:Uncharacterized protein n=1 Tax=Diplogelasinospora grovesii TaxID=303347 RepID=A0AAN6S696_9PEZI|nr:hypothetical protein QBC46DRAFT_428278 [Diplogelasinospora grovesii]
MLGLLLEPYILALGVFHLFSIETRSSGIDREKVVLIDLDERARLLRRPSTRSTYPGRLGLFCARPLVAPAPNPTAGHSRGMGCPHIYVVLLPISRLNLGNSPELAEAIDNKVRAISRQARSPPGSPLEALGRRGNGRAGQQIHEYERILNRKPPQQARDPSIRPLEAASRLVVSTYLSRVCMEGYERFVQGSFRIPPAGNCPEASVWSTERRS